MRYGSGMEKPGEDFIEFIGGLVLKIEPIDFHTFWSKELGAPIESLPKTPAYHFVMWGSWVRFDRDGAHYRITESFKDKRSRVLAAGWLN